MHRHTLEIALEGRGHKANRVAWPVLAVAGRQTPLPDRAALAGARAGGTG